MPGRFNIVISRQPGYSAGNPEVQEADSLQRPLNWQKKWMRRKLLLAAADRFIRNLILICDTIYMTRVFANLEGDAFFPEIPEDIFHLTHSKKVPADEKHAYAMDFQTWTKIKSIPEHTG